MAVELWTWGAQDAASGVRQQRYIPGFSELFRRPQGPARAPWLPGISPSQNCRPYSLCMHSLWRLWPAALCGTVCTLALDVIGTVRFEPNARAFQVDALAAARLSVVRQAGEEVGG